MAEEIVKHDCLVQRLKEEIDQQKSYWTMQKKEYLSSIEKLSIQVEKGKKGEAELLGRVDDSEYKLGKLEGQINQLKQELSMAQAQNFELDNTVESLEEKLREKDEGLNQMREDFQQLIDFKNELEAFIEDQTSQIA